MLGLITAEGSGTIGNGYVIAIALGVLAVIGVFYVLRSIGIYVLAKKLGLKNLYLAWIPFAWVYLLGKIAGDVTFFGGRFKHFTIFLTVVFCVTEAVILVENFLYYFPLVGYYLAGGKVFVASGTAQSLSGTVSALGLKSYWGSSTVFVGYNFAMPYANSSAVASAINAFIYIEYVLDIVNLVFLVLAYSAVFRKYLPGHYFVATLFSAMGLFAPFIFAVRKNKPMNYQEYMRQKYANIYGNVYRQNGGVSNQDYEKTKDAPDTPFGEFASKGESNPSDPFEEFSDSAKGNMGDKDSPFDEFDNKD